MIQRTTIVDRVAREFAAQMTTALETAREKFDHLYQDENLKSETKFKTMIKRIEKASPNKGSGNYEDLPMSRGVSSDADVFKKQ